MNRNSNNRNDIFEHYENGIQSYRDGRIFESYKSFQWVYNRDPDYRSVQYFLNVTEREKTRISNQLEHLVNDWEDSVEVEYDSLLHLINKARTEFKAGNLECCATLLDEYLFTKPDDSEVILKKIYIQKELGNFDECFRELERVLILIPNDIRPYKIGGSIYMLMGYYHEANLLYQKALRYFPESAAIFNNLGALHQEMGFLDEAVFYYNKSLGLSKDLECAKRNLHSVNCRIEYYSNKIEECKTAIDEHPEYADYHYNLGRCYQYRGFFEAARESYLKAIEINDTYIEAFFSLGETYEMEGNFLYARKFWLKIIELKKSEENPLFLRSVRLSNEGLAQESIAELKKAVEVEKDIAAAKIELGKNLYYKAEFEKAEELFREAVLSNPNYPDGHHRLGMCLIALGRLDEGKKVILEGIKLKPHMPELCYHLGLIEFRLQNFSKAAELFQKSLTLKLGDEFRTVCKTLLAQSNNGGKKPKPATKSNKPVKRAKKKKK